MEFSQDIATDIEMQKALEDTVERILAKPTSVDDKLGPFDANMNLLMQSVEKRMTVEAFDMMMQSQNLQTSITPGLPLFEIPPDGSVALKKICANVTLFGGIYHIKNGDPDSENNVIITVFKTPGTAYRFLGTTMGF